MANDILEDLKGWRDQLVRDRPHRDAGEQPGIEINDLTRAIEEIERLRAALTDKSKA
jgi:hypothetical protein